jgi:hypothetical protein
MSDQNKKTGWRKYFKVANTGGQLSPLSGARAQGLPGYGRNTQDTMDTGYAHAEMVYRNYASRLPEVYSGHPNRVERYNQYEAMDMDSEINACLDILAEFSTQADPQTNLPFQIRYTDKPTDNEVRILKQQLQQWVKLNRLDQRIFRIFRNTIKYGDQVFVRDPETFEMYWVDMTKVARVIVNESEGKRPEQYVIRDINPNFQNMTVAAKTTTDYQSNPPSSGYVAPFNYTIPTAGEGGQGFGQSRFTAAMNEAVLDAKHIVHLSLTEGLDFYWPFGQSVLETIFRVFKQKELLEDSVLIYRVARAPERRVFKIDVGNMPSHMAMQFVERVKNEIHQRRIPSRTGGGQNIMDSSYNPMSINEDYFFPQGEGGRGSSVEVLPGGCLAMDTQVPLLDGRTLTLTDLAKEYEMGHTNWVYSCDPDTGRVVPGIVSWAGITHQSAKVMKLTFDNGRTLTCTPDHRFPIMGRGLIRADELQLGESLIAFNQRNQPISQHKKTDYTQVYQNDTKQWEYVHRLVAKYLDHTGLIRDWVFDQSLADQNKDTIHHLDHDRYNNNPENLVRMNFGDHRRYHSEKGFSPESQAKGTIAAREWIDNLRLDPLAWQQHLDQISQRSKMAWQRLSPEEKSARVASQQQGIQQYFKNIDDETRAKLCQINRGKSIKGSKRLGHLLSTDTEFRKKYRAAQRQGWKKFKLTEEYIQRGQKIAQANRERLGDPVYKQRVFANQRVRYDKFLLDRVQNLVKDRTSHEFTIDDVAQHINQDQRLLTHFLDLNKDTCCSNWKNDRITTTQIASMVRQFGYKNWRHFRQEVNQYNHKLVAIEILDDPITVGTLTIDVDEIFHAYHNFALDIGVFTQNSNLGEIDDLKYFNNKMCRGLRVPSSYLPTGPDDSDRPLSDGRVGTALIQEYRFNQYCERLQRLVIEKLDDEFKMFMRWRGFNIDAGLFTIAFNPPQNFASYREAELDTTRVNTFTTLDAVPYLSKRFLLKRYLGLSEDEITENENLWQEERAQTKPASMQGQDLRSVGISPAGIESDLDMGQELAGMGEPAITATPTAEPGQQPAAGAATPTMAAPPAAGAAPTV